MEHIPHYNFVIATPGNSYTPAYVDSLLETIEFIHGEWKTYKLLNNYSSFVPSAREMTATGTVGHNWETNEIGSGEFTYDQIFWIDSDISWDVSDFEALYKSDKDIISGLYGVGAGGRTNTMRLEDGTPTSMDILSFMLEDVEVEVDGVGFGFVRMNRGVFEKVSRPWFEILKAPVEMRMVNLSEDYSFCRKAQESGFKIWVDPKVMVRHHKEIVVDLGRWM